MVFFWDGTEVFRLHDGNGNTMTCSLRYYVNMCCCLNKLLCCKYYISIIVMCCWFSQWTTYTLQMKILIHSFIHSINGQWNKVFNHRNHCFKHCTCWTEHETPSFIDIFVLMNQYRFYKELITVCSVDSSLRLGVELCHFYQFHSFVESDTEYHRCHDYLVSVFMDSYFDILVVPLFSSCHFSLCSLCLHCCLVSLL